MGFVSLQNNSLMRLCEAEETFQRNVSTDLYFEFGLDGYTMVVPSCMNFFIIDIQ